MKRIFDLTFDTTSPPTIFPFLLEYYSFQIQNKNTNIKNRINIQHFCKRNLILAIEQKRCHVRKLIDTIFSHLCFMLAPFLHY